MEFEMFKYNGYIRIDPVSYNGPSLYVAFKPDASTNLSNSSYSLYPSHCLDISFRISNLTMRCARLSDGKKRLHVTSNTIRYTDYGYITSLENKFGGEAHFDANGIYRRLY